MSDVKKMDIPKDFLAPVCANKLEAWGLSRPIKNLFGWVNYHQARVPTKCRNSFHAVAWELLAKRSSFVYAY